MAKVTSLAVSAISIEAVDYDSATESFNIEVENQTEDSSGINDRWESAVVTKSRWSASGNVMLDDALANLLDKAISNDVLVSVLFTVYTGKTYSGNAILERAGNEMRRGGITMVPISLKGVGALV